MALPEPASRHALALLRFPDRRTAWVVLLAATAPVPAPAELDERLAALHAAVPMVGARLRDETWHPGAVAPPVVVTGEPLEAPVLARPFDLAAEAPLRVVVDAARSRVALAGHHAAFDGLALVAVLATLLGGPLPSPVASPPPGEPVGPWPAVRRALRPADRVPASATAHGPRVDALAVRPLRISGRDVTARLAAACAAAAGDLARERGASWRRVGITLAVGGPAGVGNVATYRRIDVPATADVVGAATAALAQAVEPAEQVKAPRLLKLLSPISDRFSDSILVSNLGRHDVPSATRLDFFPVARGRSAVAFGAAGLTTGECTLAVRARDLDQPDAEQLLDQAVARFES